MPKISELATGTVTSAGKIAVAQGSTTIQATVADVVQGSGLVGGGGGLVNIFNVPMNLSGVQTHTISNFTSSDRVYLMTASSGDGANTFLELIPIRTASESGWATHSMWINIQTGVLSWTHQGTGQSPHTIMHFSA